ncbi:MAG: phenylalanine--tRNA ligase subunit alpha [Leptospirillum sp.]|jgi:phenylalanyl-tRNA synthetase alpha chain
MTHTFHPLEVTLLKALMTAKEPEDAKKLESRTQLSSGQLSMALGWLEAKKLIEIHPGPPETEVTVTDSGREVIEEGFPEEVIIDRIRKDPTLTIAKLREGVSDPATISKAIGDLKSQGIISILEGGILAVTAPLPENLVRSFDLIRAIFKEGSILLESLPQEDRELLEGQSRKRGKGKGILRLDVRDTRCFSLIPGRVDLEDLELEEGALGAVTPEMLQNKTYKGKRFRPYSLETPAPRPPIGLLHPYRSYLDEVRGHLVRLGFTEMSGTLVENEFWNMDALFIPQTHPARNIHDIYLIREPRESAKLNPELQKEVQAVHAGTENSAGSRGWRQPWSEAQSRRLLLRSQGTALSAHQMASSPDVPGKYFAIARCFRYDQVDQTHAVDFYQAEGIVLEPGASFKTLLGLLTLFAKEVAGAREIHFKPAYFPFTEPSVEIHVKHPVLGWMELGGAGLFRPEVTKPLGIDVPVIAWGLGIDRMAMMSLGLSDIRDLFSGELSTITRMHEARAKSRSVFKNTEKGS